MKTESPSKKSLVYQYLQNQPQQQIFTKNHQKSFSSQQTQDQMQSVCNCQNKINSLILNGIGCIQQMCKITFQKSAQFTVWYELIKNQIRTELDIMNKLYIQYLQRYYVITQNVKICINKQKHKKLMEQLNKQKIMVYSCGNSNQVKFLSLFYPSQFRKLSKNQCIYLKNILLQDTTLPNLEKIYKSQLKVEEKQQIYRKRKIAQYKINQLKKYLRLIKQQQIYNQLQQIQINFQKRFEQASVYLENKIK